MLDVLTRLKLFGSIKSRMLIYLLVFGFLIVVVLSAIEVIFEYREDISRIHLQFDQIEESFLEGISSSLWSFNTNLTQIQIEGIKALPNIAYAGVEASGSIFVESGNNSNNDNTLIQYYDLTYLYDGASQEVGKLIVVADTSSIRSRAFSSFGSTFFFEGATVALIAFFISVLMNKMLLKHVLKISQEMRKMAQEGGYESIGLDRASSIEGSEADELDVLVSSFNYLQDERSKGLAALSLSEEKFYKASQSCPQVYVFVNTANSAIIDVNDAFTNVTGWTREEAIGKTTLDLKLWTSEIRKKSTQGLAENLAIEGVEINFKVKSGESRIGLMSVHIINIAGKDCYFGIIEDISKRKDNEAEILESRERLRHLANRLEEVREEERSGIARELHDELGQSLTGMKIDLMNLSERVSMTEDVQRRIDSIVNNIDTTIDVVRRMSSELRPPVLDDLGLEAAIDWLTAGFSERTGIAYTLDVDCDDLRMGKSWDTAIFRIYQESLVNIARHSKAKNFEAEARVVDNTLLVRIQDDGIGITQEQIEHFTSIGLLGMQERAAYIGATITIENAKAGGTSVTLRAPLTSASASPSAIIANTH